MSRSEKYTPERDALRYNADIKTVLAEKGLDRNGKHWQQQLEKISSTDVERALSGPIGAYNFDRLMALISPAAENFLELIAQSAHHLTILRVGPTMTMYDPLYLSNYCSNS